MAASLSRTPSGAGNQRTWTYSGWFKLCTTDQNVFLLSAGAYGDSKSMQFLIANSGNFLQFQGFSSGGSADFNCETDAELRDIGSWYHIMVACDTTQATASDRAKIYINGQLQTLRTATYPTQNYDTGVNTTIAHEINDRPGGTFEQQLYASHIHLTDGNTYAATTFGETDATTGQWKIKTSPSVSYGTNGFFIMKDNGSGTDQSGQSNNWTANGTIINTQDNPSDNFCIISSLDNMAGNNTTVPGKLTTGNTAFSTSDANRIYTRGSFGVNSGKYYWEAKQGNGTGWAIGIMVEGMLTNTNNQFWDNTAICGVAANGSSNTLYINGASGDSWNTGITVSASSIYGFALDVDNRALYIHHNGTYLTANSAVGDPTSGSSRTGSVLGELTTRGGTGGLNYIPVGEFIYPLMVDTSTNNYSELKMNFGNGFFGTTAISSEGTNASNIGKFEYNVPTGYTALSTKGLNE